MPVQGYVISVTRGGRHRKLHHVGSCRFIPGVDYKEFEIYGALMPPMSQLDSCCMWCFGRGAGVDGMPLEEWSGNESLDSSSSSTAGVPVAKKVRQRLRFCDVLSECADKSILWGSYLFILKCVFGLFV